VPGNDLRERIERLSRQVARLAVAGRLAEAVEAAERMCEFIRRTLGDYHPALARALRNLAGLRRVTGDYRAAVALYEEALGIQRRALGPAHSAVAGTLGDLAELHRLMGDTVAARDLHRQAVQAGRQTAAEREEVGTSAAPGTPTRGMSPPAPADEDLALARAVGAVSPAPSRRPVAARSVLRGLLDAVGRLFGARGRALGHPDAALDDVECSVFAAPRLSPGEMVLVQAAVHRAEQFARAAAQARQADADAELRIRKGLLTPVPRGAMLTFHLAVRGLEVDEPVQTLRWQGCAESVQFAVTCPAAAALGNTVGTVTVSMDSVPIGSAKFKLSVVGPRPGEGPAESVELDAAGTRYRLAFISYASADRTEVLKRVQMLGRVGVDYFQDVLDLEPGDVWESKLKDYIDRCDLFLLFWSSAAKQSEWVRKEVLYAMRRQAGNELNPPDIRPVIIEGPPLVPPPEELSHLHFDDRLLYFMS